MYAIRSYYGRGGRARAEQAGGLQEVSAAGVECRLPVMLGVGHLSTSLARCGGRANRPAASGSLPLAALGRRGGILGVVVQVGEDVLVILGAHVRGPLVMASYNFV